MVKDRRDVTLGYDTYNSNDKLFRRWNEKFNKYYVLIFSDTIYNLIKDQIVFENSNIYKQSNDYNPVTGEI